MYKCLISLTVVTLISSVVSGLEDCESCVPISHCSQFRDMGREEQISWMQKNPCNRHPDDYGTPPGSISTEGAYVCCSNEIWGIEKRTSPRTEMSISNPISEENKFRNHYNTPSVFDSQNQYPTNYNNDYPNNPGQGINVPNNVPASSGNGLINSLSNRPWVSDGGPYPNRNDNQNQDDNIAISKLPTDKNKYWNERPDKNKWDIGNHIFYNGYNKNFRYNNNGRNDNENNQRSRQFYNNINSQGLGSQNNFKNNPSLPNRYKPGDTQGSKQCDRLTSFPPDPQTGCCGREASTDGRIPDAPYGTDNFAPAFNPDWESEEDLNVFQVIFSMLKDKENSSQTNTNKRFNSTITNSTASTDMGAMGVESLVDVERRISGGKETELTQYPWTALLITTFDDGRTQTGFTCGGSLISARFVLTAGHCVYDEGSEILSIQVFLAEFDKRTFPRDCKMTSDGQKCIDNISVYAEGVIRHPQFNEKRLLNDIALIKLQNDAPYTDYIRPICLPSINIDNPEHARLTLTVAGWGRNGIYKSDIKQSTTVHLVPQYDCRKFYPDLTTQHLCAAGYTGEDTCKGDSGGPLMVLYRGKYYVVGVVSGKRTDSPCGSAVPSLYTNVYHYLNWIRDNINM